LTKEQFIEYLQQPELLNQDSLSEIREMIDDYPYFPTVRMLYLRNLLNIGSYKFESELAKHAIFIPDRKVLFQLLNAPKEKENFKLLPFDDNAFTDIVEKADFEKAIEFDLPFAVPFDLIEEFEEPIIEEQQKPIDLIDRFIFENPTMINVSRKNTKPEEINIEKSDYEESDLISDGFITETLAQIYVKQKLYSEALKAYEKLSLKFPEKNSYFATQIEKIKKLISKDL